MVTINPKGSQNTFDLCHGKGFSLLFLLSPFGGVWNHGNFVLAKGSNAKIWSSKQTYCLNIPMHAGERLSTILISKAQELRCTAPINNVFICLTEPEHIHRSRSPGTIPPKHTVPRIHVSQNPVTGIVKRLGIARANLVAMATRSEMKTTENAACRTAVSALLGHGYFAPSSFPLPPSLYIFLPRGLPSLINSLSSLGTPACPFRVVTSSYFPIEPLLWLQRHPLSPEK